MEPEVSMHCVWVWERVQTRVRVSACGVPVCVPGGRRGGPPAGQQTAEWEHFQEPQCPSWGGEASLVTHKLPLASSPSDQGHSLGTCDPRIAQRPHIRAQETAGHVGVTGFHSDMSSGLQGNVR